MVAELDPRCPPDSNEFRAAVVLLGGWFGQSAGFLATLTGEPAEWVRPLARRWRAMGLWARGGKPGFRGPLAEALMADPEPAGQAGQSCLTFWLIVACGLGAVEYDVRTGLWTAARPPAS